MSEQLLGPTHRTVTERGTTPSPLPTAAPLPAGSAGVVVSPDEQAARAHATFRLIARVTNALLTLAILAALCCAAWEYSTQRYVDAFSDAIVPVSGSAERKIQSILDWMAQPPARIVSDSVVGHDRDPVDTLNYKALLEVCGTATNAFINLADTSDLRARRLLLLDSNGGTKHVDAEVWVGARWIVVDPTFRVILRGLDGRMLTDRELANPVVFSAATRAIPAYDPSYSFERTEHIRLAGIPIVGRPVQRVLNFLVPAWQDSAEISLIFERESLLALSIAVVIVLMLLALRLALYWIGSTRLGVRSPSLSRRLQSAYRAFMRPAS